MRSVTCFYASVSIGAELFSDPRLNVLHFSSYFNAVKGIEDPEQFIPPSFCSDAETEDEELDFFSAFL